MPPQFIRYWTAGAGAAKIRWGIPGDFDRAIRAIQAEIVKHGEHPLPDHEIKGLVATLHKMVTGATPGHAPAEMVDHAIRNTVKGA